jgi:hypothetical protein
MRLSSIGVVIVCVVFCQPLLAAEAGKVVTPSQQHLLGTPKNLSPAKIIMPDLITESILSTPSSPQQNDPVGPITVKIKNQGNGTAPASTAVFGCLGSWCSPMNCNQCSGWNIATWTSGIGWTGKWSIPILNPGASIQYTFVPLAGGDPQKWVSGSYLFTCTVDRDDAAHEINENNNIKTLNVTVK